MLVTNEDSLLDLGDQGRGRSASLSRRPLSSVASYARRPLRGAWEICAGRAHRWLALRPCSHPTWSTAPTIEWRGGCGP